jgi:hypothetical protein
MIGAFMRGAYMGDANLAGAYMRDANMTGAFMAGADMSNANMRAANMRGANLANANMRAANMRGANLANANMRGATLPHGIVRITAPESEAEPEATPAAAERRRIEWFKRYENPNGTQTIYARDQDGRAWWLILHPDAPDTWTEVTPLPSYQEKP